jgi:hypothetical protein
MVAIKIDRRYRGRCWDNGRYLPIERVKAVATREIARYRAVSGDGNGRDGMSRRPAIDAAASSCLPC